MAITKELIEQINRFFTENRMDAFMYYLSEVILWDIYTASSGHTRSPPVCTLQRFEIKQKTKNTLQDILKGIDSGDWVIFQRSA